MSDLIPAWVEGRLTPVDKMEVHRLGLRHKAVSVFVVAGARVLIQRRALGKYHTPGLWANTCCTHPDWAESPADCAARRLREELGITGLALEPREAVEYRADVGGGLTEHELVDIFVAKADTGLPLAPDPAEVMAVDWVDLEALAQDTLAHPDRYTPWLRIYLSDHRARIFGALAG
ncbi:MAG: isopentenyl-diphosphate Delta-isomerase [Rhodobacteraceae bacterium]|nr:isopentenyl-diphosphate Delta-isomerase [Paracoccaceae bacterium]